MNEKVDTSRDAVEKYALPVMTHQTDAQRLREIAEHFDFCATVDSKRTSWGSTGVARQRNTADFLRSLADRLSRPCAEADEEMAERVAFAMCLDHCGDEESAHELIWEGHPPEPWGEAWQKYIPDAKAFLRAYASVLRAKEEGRR